ncbi:TonB-dependent copper receptor [Andreprevotia chitinilytica]|uniref:TonB-dependent copper receptor n=1 Tax=Andreprevotia chitinilytica TaxID=396808 RepID=UPI000A04BBC8|nr:TonB-dependent copper receptor [Andreprevotia chitinilytica]
MKKSISRPRPLALALACALAAPVLVFAASEPAADSIPTQPVAAAVTAPGATPVYDLDPVIVTAARQTAPLTVVTDPKKPRQPVPASDGADYLKTIPGFSSIRNGGSNGDPVFRGMFGSRINLQTDGTTMLGACPARMDTPTSYVSPETYDKITVIKGPESVIWGPGASAGTVKFDRDTKRFEAPGARVEASALVGSFGRNDGNIDATVGNPTGYVRITGNHSHSGDYSDGDGNTVGSKWNKWNTDAAIGWTPDDLTKLELTVGTGNGEARYAGRSMDGTQFKRESASLKFERRAVSDSIDKVEAQVYYNYADHVMDNYTLRQPTTQMPAMATNLDRKTIGGRVAATMHWTDDLSFIAGVDGSTNTHRRRGGAGIDTYLNMPWVQDAKMSDIGTFGQLTWNRSDLQRVIGGVRIDRANAYDDRVATGPKPPVYDHDRSETLKSGFVRYEQDLAGSPTAVFAGIGHSERMPDFWELFSPKYGPDGAVNAFSAIRPEKTTQLDFGAQYHGKNVQAWASMYAGYVKDYILFSYDNKASMMGLTATADNIDARIAGGELGANYQWNNWKFDGSLAYSWGEDITRGEAMPQLPPMEARFGATYATNKWSLGALWRLAAAQTRIAQNEGNVVGRDFGPSAGFGVFSLNGSYDFNKTVRLTAGVDNVFNKEYTEHLNRAGDAGFGYAADTTLQEPGRTLWIKLGVKY